MHGLGPFFLIIVAAVLLALLGLVLMRRTVPHDRLARHTDVVLDTPYKGVSAIEPTAMDLVRTEIDADLGKIGSQP